MEELQATPVVEQINTEATEDVVMVKSNVTIKKKPVYDFLKRFADILISLVALTCGLPFFMIIIRPTAKWNKNIPVFFMKS